MVGGRECVTGEGECSSYSDINDNDGTRWYSKTKLTLVTKAKKIRKITNNALCSYCIPFCKRCSEVTMVTLSHTPILMMGSAHKSTVCHTIAQVAEE